MRGGRRALALALALALSLLCTCAQEPDLPEPPDVSNLVSVYAQPPGTVDPSRPLAWLDFAELQVAQLGGGQADVLIARIAASAFRDVDRASLPSGRDQLVPTRIDGIATVEVQCGLAPHERAEVVVAIVDGAASPLMWGSSHACPLWEQLGAREAYDGSFTMVRYPSSDLLVRIDGKLSGAGSRIALDFKVVGGRLETRVPTPTGDVIVAQAGSELVTRAANGTFRCSTALRTCR